jgi:hypothetical protein
MQRASEALGDRRRVRDRRRSVGRRVLIIVRQVRSPETRDPLVHSYRRRSIAISRSSGARGLSPRRIAALPQPRMKRLPP